jgi:hypothetical protein
VILICHPDRGRLLADEACLPQAGTCLSFPSAPQQRKLNHE